MSICRKESLGQVVNVSDHQFLAMFARNKSPMLNHDKEQEVLFREVGVTHMGVSETGHPVAAVILNKALTR